MLPGMFSKDQQEAMVAEYLTWMLARDRAVLMLDRIASALESIDSKLETYVKDDDGPASRQEN